MSTMDGRRVLITGAGRNIGAELARSFAADGHEVLLVGRREGPLATLADEIRCAGGRARHASCDVTDRGATFGLAEVLADSSGFHVDILVNCAMVRVQRPFLEMTLEEWEEVLGVVLTGAFNMTQLCLPGMYERRWGRVINIAGLAGQAGAVNRAGIVTAKAGILGFTKAIALEAAPYSVTSNAVSPGIIDTVREIEEPGRDGSDLARAHYANEIKHIPLGRMGKQAEVVAAVRYLASEDAGFITGQVINVNGGRYMG